MTHAPVAAVARCARLGDLRRADRRWLLKEGHIARRHRRRGNRRRRRHRFEDMKFENRHHRRRHAGVSVAYPLAKLGRRDIVLLEQGRVLRHYLARRRPRRPMTARTLDDAHEPIRHPALLSLEQETGLAHRWKQCGQRERLAHARRLIVFQRQPPWRAASASRSTCSRRARRWRNADPADRRPSGRAVVSGGRQSNPPTSRRAGQGRAQLVVKIRKGYASPWFVWKRDLSRESPRRTAISIARFCVNCAGNGARALGAQSGVNIPLHSAALLHRDRAASQAYTLCCRDARSRRFSSTSRRRSAAW